MHNGGEAHQATSVGARSVCTMAVKCTRHHQSEQGLLVRKAEVILEQEFTLDGCIGVSEGLTHSCTCIVLYPP